MICEYLIRTMNEIISMTDSEIGEYQSMLKVNRALIERELRFTEIILEDRRTADEIIHSKKNG